MHNSNIMLRNCNKMADTEATETAGETEREILRGFLNKRLRVELSDGRFVLGDLLCTDRDMNIVLGNCEENIPRAQGAQGEER